MDFRKIFTGSEEEQPSERGGAHERGPDSFELRGGTYRSKFSPFRYSLDNLTQDDLAPVPPKKKRELADIVSSVIRGVIMTVCVCVFLGSAVTLTRSLVDYKRGDDLYGSIADNIFNTDLSGAAHAVALSPKSRASQPLSDYYTSLTEDAAEIDDYGETSYNLKFEQMKANLTYLRTLNPDIYGYIHIEGTNISFPIVQYTDNDYYLDHAYTGEYMVVGSIFADFRAYSNMDYNENTVFYGHNMKDGNMFNNVMNFFDEEVFDTKLIEIYTFDGIYTYKPYAIFETIDTEQYFQMYFETGDDFVAFCEKYQKKSVYNRGYEFTEDDRVITLSTCTNVSYNGRYALQARLISVER